MVTSVGDGPPDMTDPGQTIDFESWDFALKLYAQPGIADACLRLQAECSVDVMMLLTAAFAAVRRGIVLQASDIQDMDEACRELLRGLPGDTDAGTWQAWQTQIRAALTAAGLKVSDSVIDGSQPPPALWSAGTWPLLALGAVSLVTLALVVLLGLAVCAVIPRAASPR